MASLKDLRNRITSVKATQKITKAMQMVAAAKLRRAQMAAEAGRPYAEKMSAVLGNLAGNLVGGVGAPKLLSGTGSEQTHLLVVCTGDRGLAGAFNSSIVRLAVREYAQKLAAEGKTVKIMTVGKKGLDALRRQYRDQIVESMDIRGNRPVDYEFAASIADKILTRFEAGEFDVATLFYSEFRSVISQIPTAQRLIPAELPAADTTAKAAAGNAVRGGDPGDPAAEEPDGADLPGAPGERRLRAGRPHERHGLGHPQRGRDDQEADAGLQPDPSGHDHQGTHRDHLGRGSPLRHRDPTAQLEG